MTSIEHYSYLATDHFIIWLPVYGVSSLQQFHPSYVHAPLYVQGDEEAQVVLLREELRTKATVSYLALTYHFYCSTHTQESLQLERAQKSLSEQLEAKSELAPHKLIGQSVTKDRYLLLSMLTYYYDSYICLHHVALHGAPES